jgi:hypothetical protein
MFQISFYFELFYLKRVRFLYEVKNKNKKNIFMIKGFNLLEKMSRFVQKDCFTEF